MEQLVQEGRRKRGRRPKNESKEYILNKEQVKFFIDLAKDKNSLEMVQNLLIKANKKDFGKEITIKELAIFGLAKITQKDLEKIQEDSLSEMEKVRRAQNEYNLKNKTNLDLGEFLVKRLNIT